MKVAESQVAKFLPAYKGDVAALTSAINLVIDKYDLSTLRRVRYFMAQCAFESRNFTKLVEDLFYSTPSRIVEVWPRKFSLTGQSGKLNAFNYTRNPAALANAVYAHVNGNGDEASGDGFKYRGRGAIHLTGKANYAAASQFLFGDDRLVTNPDQVESDIVIALLTAAWFWATNKLNSLADQDQFTLVTKVINGSTVTVPQRLPVLSKAKAIFL